MPIAEEVVGDMGGKLCRPFGLAALVLLIACVNVVNLMLAQATVGAESSPSARRSAPPAGD